MKTTRHILAVLLAAAATGAARAQGEAPLRLVNDAQLWFSAATEFKPFRKKQGQVAQARFFRKLRATVELDLRLKENASELNQTNINAGLFYAITNYMRVGSEYRYSIRDPYSANRHRIDAQLRFKGKKGRLDGDFRTKYQHSFVAPKKLRTELRNRIGLEYDIPKWKLDPIVNVESFTALHYTGNRLVGMRYDLGTEFRLDKNKQTTLEITLRHDREMNIKEPDHAWVLALAFEYSPKKK
ncbi:MAG: DUF2490 domain-containing protein [Flavobacteriales bacterium]|nr:DUF2490 domain-containing protein [Flavobacteriales bacterium]